MRIGQEHKDFLSDNLGTGLKLSELKEKFNEKFDVKLTENNFKLLLTQLGIDFKVANKVKVNAAEVLELTRTYLNQGYSQAYIFDRVKEHFPLLTLTNFKSICKNNIDWRKENPKTTIVFEIE